LGFIYFLAEYPSLQVRLVVPLNLRSFLDIYVTNMSILSQDNKLLLVSILPNTSVTAGNLFFFALKFMCRKQPFFPEEGSKRP